MAYFEQMVTERRKRVLGQWELLRSDPRLLPQSIEEVLRYREPVQLMFRIVMRDTELGGATIEAGKRVVVFMGAANRDPAKYDNPNAFSPRDRLRERKDV